jgi:hypothetical protein
MAEQYFVKRGETVKGPFSLDKLQSLLGAKKLKANDLIGTSDGGPWERMTAVHKTIRAGQPLSLPSQGATAVEELLVAAEGVTPPKTTFECRCFSCEASFEGDTPDATVCRECAAELSNDTEDAPLSVADEPDTEGSEPVQPAIPDRLTAKADAVAPSPAESMPKTVACTDCGGIVSRRAHQCPHCGAPFGQSEDQVPSSLVEDDDGEKLRKTKALPETSGKSATDVQVGVMTQLGGAMFGIGVLMVLYAMFMFDTSVESGFGRVHNIGLMRDQTNLMIFGGILAVAGMALAFAGGQQDIVTSSKRPFDTSKPTSPFDTSKLSSPFDTSKLSSLFDTSKLSDKYAEEFKKIHQSNGSYKGGFNVMAFLFGPLWALSKGLWLHALVVFFAVILSGGILAIPAWIFSGVRGTHVFYLKHVQGQQSVW